MVTQLTGSCNSSDRSGVARTRTCIADVLLAAQQIRFVQSICPLSTNKRINWPIKIGLARHQLFQCPAMAAGVCCGLLLGQQHEAQRPQLRPLPATAQRTLLSASVTASGPMPNCLYSTGPGAEAPKVSTPMEMPFWPTYFSQPNVEPACGFAVSHKSDTRRVHTKSSKQPRLSPCASHVYSIFQA